MDSWMLVDSVVIPEESGTQSVMALMRRGRELVIRVDGRELMGSRTHGSEEALFDLAHERMGARPEARVLVGGLGMGFTLAAALRKLGPDAHAVVAELVPAVIRWNRGPIAEEAGAPLSDPRAEIYEGDVADLIRTPPAPWDAILLDVDNGPLGLTRASNGWLYSHAGLVASHAALAPGGVLGVWSAFLDTGFTRRMKRAGFKVEVEDVRARGRKGGPRHVVWLGTR
ncbi:MAG: spermidine synthase [Deltaproteobacteria bacterium]|nr:spermidine synthase [Deltaproteobacteria bacterium]